MERIDAYGVAIDATIDSLRQAGFSSQDRNTWSTSRELFRSEHAADPFHEIAETFYNSLARRLFETKGIDPHLEFLEPAPGVREVTGSKVFRTYRHDGDRRTILSELLRDCRFHASWPDLNHDLDRGALRLPAMIGEVEVIDTMFFRGKGAYVVGRFIGESSSVPFALAVRHGPAGLRLAAVLVGERDLAILFSYTRAAFMVAVDQPSELVRALNGLLPGRRTSEIYSAIGFRKQSKTEGYRELARHLKAGVGRFVHTQGVPGLVMIVFTLERYDVVFKVVRDRFPPQKTVTPDDVAKRYRLVSRHDRAGRLVEAQRFVDLRLPVATFEDSVLDELLDQASRAVSVHGDQVNLATVYVERKVIPLDVYLKEAEPEAARAAILDYGNAIKNLAASNIFPGDMLLKNFGVTSRGRVVFYDYDELGLLTDLRFRSFPESDDPNDMMSVTPSFGMGPNDIFPEELERFLGLSGDLRTVFNEQHADLFDTPFWTTVQSRLNGGETIEILPYRRSRALETT